MTLRTSVTQFPRIMMLLLCVLIGANTLQAQVDDGQFCVRAYEDRNGNGQRDSGEDVLADGIGANLVDATGAIIRTALMETSPTNTQGLICFEGLANGQYTLFVTSAEYFPTGLDNLTITITDERDTRTTLFEYGAQPLLSLVPESAFQEAESEFSDDEIERILIATIGALIAMMGTAFIGLILYLLFLRGRARRAAAAYPPGGYYRDPRISTGSGSVPRVPPTDTGEYRR